MVCVSSVTRLLLPFLLLVACSPREEIPPVSVTRRGDLTIESRPLRMDATMAAVGLAPAGDRREGESEWDSSFSDAEGRAQRDSVEREFRLTIVNRGATASEFHARIDYLGVDGKLVRRRALEKLVVPPFTETTWSGSVSLPPPGGAEVVTRVLRSTEPFELPVPQ